MRAALATALCLLCVPALHASDWCDDEHSWERDDRYCEVRELEVSSSLTELEIDASPNGGIGVEGWDKSEVRLIAIVQVHADDADEARSIASEVRVATDGVVRASGPRGLGWRRGWSVSYRAWVPRQFDLTLESNNGGISVQNVSGRISLETNNGGLSAHRLAGDVRGRTNNGGVTVELEGERWDGRGLDLRTTNGGVVLEVPEGYNAELETKTVNGGVVVDFPILFQGSLRHGIDVALGEGGAPIRVETTNGGVRLRRP